MTFVVIADGITNEFIGRDASFETGRSHVGPRERARLLGERGSWGAGPLAVFLREVANDSSILSLLVRDTRDGRADMDDLPGPLEEFGAIAKEIAAQPGCIPAPQLTEFLGNARDATILLVGTHTEQRIFNMAAFLVQVVGAKQVAVCSHLTGSGSPAAHLTSYRHNFLVNGVKVFLDLGEAAGYLGLSTERLSIPGASPCHVGPSEVREAISDEQRRIIELLCMHWNSAEMRPLAGGFSGSLLFLANGEKGRARTEPVVLKIDAFAQMRRELDGYYRVKDFLGKHVPTFGLPVGLGDQIGVAMELAAMEGSPKTLQDDFEAAESEAALQRFDHRLDRALRLLAGKLYENTSSRGPVVPFRQLGLHTQQQQQWLEENGGLIGKYLEELGHGDLAIDAEQLAKVLKVVGGNVDAVESEVCLVHGDLNLANVISDEADNVWFIDWTHCGLSPVELDFAKIENDIKFVMSKDFDPEDLPRLRRFEEFLLEHQMPPDVGELPETLRFARWDLRFRKILLAVRHIRSTCFAIKKEDDWLVYKIALLRYALHTLSFDKRRDRGECDESQLAHAMFSAETLLYALIADDFHLKIRSARPDSYPPRQRISIDESHWMLDCESYEPPYHVDPSVLDSEGRWADPEDFQQVADRASIAAAKYKSEEGLPLNPRGRTGIAGRGLLGLWGPNPAVAAIITRPTADASSVEILVGRQVDDGQLRLPKGFIARDESDEQAVKRVLQEETGLAIQSDGGSLVFDDFVYDKRQTDNAWVTVRAYLYRQSERRTEELQPGNRFIELKYFELTADLVNMMAASHAHQVREAIPHLVHAGDLTQEQGSQMLAKTG